jgi:hypothetical protein
MAQPQAGEQNKQRLGLLKQNREGAFNNRKDNTPKKTKGCHHP